MLSRRADWPEWLVVPGFLLLGTLGTTAGLDAQVPLPLVPSLSVGLCVALAALLERTHPARPEQRRLDQPLHVELLHFSVNYQLGYAAAYLGYEAIRSWAHGLASWPARLPFVLQLVLALLLSEGVSYWQHRFSHRAAWLWRFHALHHHGTRLNLLRAGRFHGVDIGSAAFMGFLPLALLSAPAEVLTWVVVISGVLGVLQHANLRVKTPRWLDRLVCTPAVHRLHHSSRVAESNTNFSTTFMLFDHLFGSYRAPTAPFPDAVGIERDPVAPGFWAQVWMKRAEPLSARQART